LKLVTLGLCILLASASPGRADAQTEPAAPLDRLPVKEVTIFKDNRFDGPSARFVDLPPTHAIFHSFFEIPDPLRFLPPYEQDLTPVYYGLYEDNDPTKRLMAIVNYNNDISEYWEFSNTGFAPISETNEAYKLGVNYIIYGLTH